MSMSADRIEKTVSWLKNIAVVKNNSKAADLLVYIGELEARVNTPTQGENLTMYQTNELVLKALEQIVNNPLAAELAKRFDDLICEGFNGDVIIDDLSTELDEAREENEELEARVNTLEEAAKNENNTRS